MRTKGPQKRKWELYFVLVYLFHLGFFLQIFIWVVFNLIQIFTFVHPTQYFVYLYLGRECGQKGRRSESGRTPCENCASYPCSCTLYLCICICVCILNWVVFHFLKCDSTQYFVYLYICICVLVFSHFHLGIFSFF